MEKFENIMIIRAIVLAIITTNLPLIGIYTLPNEWWGILIKIILVLLMVSMLVNYFRDPYWKGIGPGTLLNIIWFSGMWFFSTHWVVYIFGLLYVVTLGTIWHILKVDGPEVLPHVTLTK
jgi:hypothetical protein